MNIHFVCFCLLLAVATYLPARENPQDIRVKDVKLFSKYPWKRDITTTCFWIGEGSCGYNDTTNYKSAWDKAWTRNYGGVDRPDKRVQVSNLATTTLPKKFAPTLNPFYVALPFNDVAYPELAHKFVPWWDHGLHLRNPKHSQCKGRWIMIEHDGNVAFAQWEDVGPFRYDHAKYVFGSDRPRTYSGAGLDISPAVRDYLGLDDTSSTNWRFVEDSEVPYGPWIEYGEQAILYSVIKKEPKRKNSFAAVEEDQD